MKNRTTLKHGMLIDFRDFLERCGWNFEKTKGQYEVLRASKKGRKRLLLVHNRTTGGCGYSIDERDMKIYKEWEKDRRERGIDPYFPTKEEMMKRDNELKELE